jgi:hypothetical protein
MSSHHFVKEGQEPTLVIISIASASFEHIQTLLEWSPKVFVADSALLTVLQWNIKIDGVIVQPLQIKKWQQELRDQEPLQWVEYRDGLMLDALAALSKQNHQKLQIVDDVGMLPFSDLQDLPCETVTLIRYPQRWSLIRAGKWTKWMPGGTTFSLISVSNTTEHTVQSDGSHTVELPPPFWVGEVL